MVRRYVIRSSTGRSIVALMSEEKIKELTRSMADASGYTHEVFDEGNAFVKFTFIPNVQSPEDPMYHGDHEDDEDQEE